MDSKEIKRKLIHYFRFFRRYYFCATEVGEFYSDVMVANSKEVIEIEVKVDKYDLINDFKKKKHFHYKKKTKALLKYIPNKFYFAVPKHLVYIAEQYVKDTPYGIIMILEGKENTGNHKIKIIKRASFIHKEETAIRRTILLRMGSEVYTAQSK